MINDKSCGEITCYMEKQRSRIDVGALGGANWSFPADTSRNNDVIITSKRRRFDVIATVLLRHVFSGLPPVASLLRCSLWRELVKRPDLMNRDYPNYWAITIYNSISRFKFTFHEVFLSSWVKSWKHCHCCNYDTNDPTRSPIPTFHKSPMCKRYTLILSLFFKSEQHFCKIWTMSS